MKKKFSIDFLFTLIGAIYILFSIFPLIKSLFSSRNNVTYGNKEEWVEVPLIAGE